jgi:hypothetical protein
MSHKTCSVQPTYRSVAFFFACAALCALGPAFPAQGGTIIFDDFESYADTAALDATWPIGVGSSSTTFLDVGPAGSTNTSKTVRHTNRNARRDRTITPTLPLAGQPLIVSFDMYDAAVDTGASEYIQMLAFDAANALSQLLSIGKTSLATTNGANNPNKYQARVAFPPAAGGGVNWINLNTNRSVGWHNFAIEIFPTTVNFYVDGVLDTGLVPRAGGVGDPFSVVRIGSGLGARVESAYYDNFSVVLVPEPASVALLAVGAAGPIIAMRLSRRPRRRRSTPLPPG